MSALEPIRPEKATTLAPCALARASLPALVLSVHFLALRSFREALTHLRPLRRPDPRRAIATDTFAGSERRNLSFVPFDTRLRLRGSSRWASFPPRRSWARATRS